VNIRIPRAINGTAIRKSASGAPLARKVRASAMKVPKAAKKIPIPEYILLKLRLRLAKINVLFGNLL
jgi:hypothetical protein